MAGDEERAAVRVGGGRDARRLARDSDAAAPRAAARRRARDRLPPLRVRARKNGGGLAVVPGAQRLTSLQVANFVADGALRFDGIVPRALSDAALGELAGGGPPSPFGADPGSPAAAWPGRPLAGLFRDWPALAAVLELPGRRRRNRKPARPRSDLRPSLRARDRAAQHVEPAVARRRNHRSAADRLRHPALLLLSRHPARDGRHHVPAGQPPAPNQRICDRPLPELRRPGGDGLPGGARCSSATTASGTAVSRTGPIDSARCSSCVSTHAFCGCAGTRPT